MGAIWEVQESKGSHAWNFGVGNTPTKHSSVWHDTINLQYNTSFDWQIPVWQKLANESSENNNESDSTNDEVLEIIMHVTRDIIVDGLLPEQSFSSLYTAIRLFNLKKESR